MKKIFTIVLIVLLCVFAVSGCSLFGDDNEEQAEIESLDSIDTQSFGFKNSTMRSGYYYYAEKTEDGTYIYLETGMGDRVVDKVIEEDVLDEISKVVGKYRLDKWDGFDKANNAVLDGEQFVLSMSLADGTDVYADGSNAFPPMYAEAKSEIEDIFKEIIYKYADIYSKTLDSDNLTYIYLMFTGEDGYDYRQFKFNAQKNDDGSTLLDIGIKGYEAWGDKEDYFFYGNADDFPYAEFQNIVRKYDMPSWNGWELDAENYDECEWFEVDLSYDSEERISATGTQHPENYDAARQEILEFCVNYIEENQDSFTPWEG